MAESNASTRVSEEEMVSSRRWLQISEPSKASVADKEQLLSLVSCAVLSSSTVGDLINIDDCSGWLSGRGFTLTANSAAADEPPVRAHVRRRRLEFIRSRGRGGGDGGEGSGVTC